MTKEVEIRVGKNFAKDMANLVKHPEKLPNKDKEIIYVDSPKIRAAILSNERINLLRFIGLHKSTSISEIAEKLHRKREAVSRDLHFLGKFGLVSMQKKGRNTIAKVVAEKVSIPITV